MKTKGLRTMIGLSLSLGSLIICMTTVVSAQTRAWTTKALISSAPQELATGEVSGVMYAQDASKKPHAAEQALPNVPGVYYDARGEFKPLGSEESTDETKMVALPAGGTLVIVYAKDAVHVEGLRIGRLSEFGPTNSSDGGIVFDFTHLDVPTKTEPIPGRPDAFRFTLPYYVPSPNEVYYVVSESVDEKNGKKKLTIHATFLVKAASRSSRSL